MQHVKRTPEKHQWSIHAGIFLFPCQSWEHSTNVWSCRRKGTIHLNFRRIDNRSRENKGYAFSWPPWIEGYKCNTALAPLGKMRECLFWQPVILLLCYLQRAMEMFEFPAVICLLSRSVEAPHKADSKFSGILQLLSVEKEENSRHLFVRISRDKNVQLIHQGFHFIFAVLATQVLYPCLVFVYVVAVSFL